MNRSRRWIAAVAVTLLAAGAGTAFGSNVTHGNGPRAGTSAGGSWYNVTVGMSHA
jgi:hypothetical protein